MMSRIPSTGVVLLASVSTAFALVPLGIVSLPFLPDPSVAYADESDDTKEEWVRLSEEAEHLYDEVVSLQNRISETQDRIEDIDSELPGIEAQACEARTALGSLMSSQYKSGTTIGIEAFLDAESLPELVDALEYAQRLNGQARRVLDAVTESESRLSTERRRLASEMDELDAATEEHEHAIKQAEDAAAKARRHYAEMSSASREELVREDAALRRKARESSAKLSHRAGSTSATAEEIVSRACEILGSGYSWSGYSWTGSPSSSVFTCSGVVDYALGRPSWSSSPQTLYNEVGSNLVFDTSQLEYGDAVFYEFGGGIGHVGIYVGDGLIIDSIPNGGVAVRDVDYMTFLGGGPLV